MNDYFCLILKNVQAHYQMVQQTNKVAFCADYHRATDCYDCATGCLTVLQIAQLPYRMYNHAADCTIVIQMWLQTIQP